MIHSSIINRRTASFYFIKGGTNSSPCPRLWLSFRVVAKNNGSVVMENARQPFSGSRRGVFSRLRFSPFLAQLVIIRRCNLSCGYCSEFDKTSKPIPTSVLEKRLRKLKSLGTFGISLTGGEPTRHPDIPHLIPKCREIRFFRTGMISNGLLLRPHFIDPLNQS